MRYELACAGIDTAIRCMHGTPQDRVPPRNGVLDRASGPLRTVVRVRVRMQSHSRARRGSMRGVSGVSPPNGAPHRGRARLGGSIRVAYACILDNPFKKGVKTIKSACQVHNITKIRVYCGEGIPMVSLTWGRDRTWGYVDQYGLLVYDRIAGHFSRCHFFSPRQAAKVRRQIDAYTKGR